MGIDAYAHPAINELSFAERDARALHALFADNLGEGELLLGAGATRSAIADAFVRLHETKAEDMVVISFSGHGSETHELVCVDTDPAQISATTIGLNELTEWFAAVPAQRLMCILDCCFSGGMGAKVLAAVATSRSLYSEASKLDALAGEGRIILTASSASQPAWEQARLGHGLLTASVLEALAGPDEVRSGGRISVMRLLDFVVKRVVDTARGFAREQQPAVRGTFEGELLWPVFERKERFAGAFPELSTVPAVGEIRSLAGHGVNLELLEAWRRDVPMLNDLQLAAVNDSGVLRGGHLVVSAPTSSGKTMVGELAALHGVVSRRRAWFLVPLKALVNDKHQEFVGRYGELGVRTIRATGDFDREIGVLLSGRYDIALMTYETATALALRHPHLLEGVGTVVVDEAQMIVDETRGIGLEFMLTVLRARREDGIEPQLITLSAVIGDTGGLERWLGARLLRRTERPVPLDEGVLGPSGDLRVLSSDGGPERIEQIVSPLPGRGSAQALIIPLARDLVAQGEQIIVFRNERGKTVGTARYLARSLGLSACEGALAALPDGDPSASSAALRDVLHGGVAFHNSDLSREERLVVEEAFRRREIRVIAATTTLAMGVNTPASSVILAELGFWSRPFTVAEYKNMVGRAGRLGFSSRGRSFAIAGNALQAHQAFKDYVEGTPEDLKSRFFDADVRALVLRALAAGSRIAGGGMTAAQVARFLSNAFGIFQQRRDGLPTAEIAGNVAELQRLAFITADSDGILHLEPLGRLAGESGVEIETMVRLADAAPIVGPAPSVGELIVLTQLTRELDEARIGVNARSHQEKAAWTGELRRRGLGQLAHALQRRAVDTKTVVSRAKKAVGLLMWIEGVPRADIEATIMRHHRDREAAGAIESAADRTADILPVAGQVVGLRFESDCSASVDEALVRLALGIPADLVELATIAGRDLARPTYLKLRAAGLGSVAALRALPEKDLVELLGRRVSERVATS